MKPRVFEIIGLAVLVSFGAALAGAGPPAASGWSASTGSHAWAVIPSVRGPMLVHLPPRASATAAAKPAPDGTVRPAHPLELPPDALAAIGDQVYLLFVQPTLPGLNPGYGVYSARARPSSVGDLWSFEPEGKLTEHLTLRAGGVLHGFAGSPFGPVALVGGAVHVLGPRGWSQHPLPVPVAARMPGARVKLVPNAEGIGVVQVNEHGAVERWTGVVAPVLAEGIDWKSRSTRKRERATAKLGTPTTPAQPDAAPGTDEILWSKRVLATDGSARELVAESDVLAEVGGELVVFHRVGMTVSIHAISRATARRIAEVPDTTDEWFAVTMPDLARAIVAWIAPDPAATKISEAATPSTPRAGYLEVREISLHTGRTLYAGPQRGDAPVTAGDLQLLAAVLTLLMAAVLVLVLTRDPARRELVLPDGVALAEPGRRATAGLIDAAVALAVSAKLWSLPLLQVLGPEHFLSGDALRVAGTAMAIGAGLGALGEWLTGRSLGKAFMGCAVIDARRPLGPASTPTLAQSLVRNGLKYAAFPAAMLGLMDPPGRHRADAIARCAVVIPDRDDEGDAE